MKSILQSVEGRYWHGVLESIYSRSAAMIKYFLIFCLEDIDASFEIPLPGG